MLVNQKVLFGETALLYIDQEFSELFLQLLGINFLKKLKSNSILSFALFLTNIIPKIPNKIFADHIPQKGESRSLSDNFSPPIKKAQ